MVLTYLCPFTKNCPIYGEWALKKDKRLDIISRTDFFFCKALEAVYEDNSQHVPLNRELRERMGGLSISDKKECSYIELLNSHLESLLKMEKIKELIREK